MSGAESLIKKKRRLVIGSDEEESEPAQVQAKSEPKPVESKPEKQPHHPSSDQKPKPQARDAPRQTQDENQKSNKSTASTDRNGSFAKDKLARKDEERVQSTISKQTEEADWHASDDDLFLPDDSNTADLESIRQANKWKKKPVTESANTAPPQQRTIDRHVSQRPAQPVSKPQPTIKRETSSKKPKDALIYDVLKRWWYALPDWPPANYDYGPSLEEYKLRVVPKDKFRYAPETDDKGRAKCFEVLGYTGVFKDKNNKTYDLRPLENKPCYSQFAKKDTSELIGLFKIALKNQIEALETSKVVDQALLSSLKNQYSKVKDR